MSKVMYAYTFIPVLKVLCQGLILSREPAKCENKLDGGKLIFLYTLL